MSEESYKKLTHVTELGVKFKDAVEKKFGSDQKLAAKMMTKLKPGELEAVQDKLQAIVNESLGYAFGGTPTEEFVRKNLEIVDLTAEFALRVMPAEKLAPLVPAELKSDENVQYLRDLGANSLATVSAFKPK
jgi:hypothetical protein